MKKIIIIASIVISTMIIAYTGYENVVYHSSVTSINDFFDAYINNVQKYIFNGLIYYSMIVYAISKPYLIPEYKIRIGSNKNLINRIVSEAFISSFLASLIVVMLNYCVAILSDCSGGMNGKIVIIWGRLFIFYLECNALFQMIYVITKNRTIACIGFIVINLLFLVAVYSLDFIFLNRLQLAIDNIFVIYICVVLLAALTFTLKKIYKKEIL